MHSMLAPTLVVLTGVAESMRRLYASLLVEIAMFRSPSRVSSATGPRSFLALPGECPSFVRVVQSGSRANTARLSLWSAP
jgi:hypothetical protein